MALYLRVYVLNSNLISTCPPELSISRPRYMPLADASSDLGDGRVPTGAWNYAGVTSSV